VVSGWLVIEGGPVGWVRVAGAIGGSTADRLTPGNTLSKGMWRWTNRGPADAG
jgi:hypothetical protein